MDGIEILGISDSARWNEVLESLPPSQQDVYFTPGYHALYERKGDGRAQCFIYRNKGSVALYPFLLNSVNELGYDLDDRYFDIQGVYGYNGIISSDYGPVFRNQFYHAFQQYLSQKNIIAEFVRFHPLIENHRFQPENDEIRENRKTVFLDLNGSEEEIWEKHYSSTNRNMIRKARKNGIMVELADSETSYREFSAMYTETMKRVSASAYYFFDAGYFSDFRILMEGKHHLVTAKYEDTVIAGMLLTIHGDYANYHLSGRLPEHTHPGVNNLMLDYAVKLAKEKGCRYFYLGGGNSQEENDPLLKFKRNFSDSLKPFYISRKIHNETVYNRVVELWEKRYSGDPELLSGILLKYRQLEP